MLDFKKWPVALRKASMLSALLVSVLVAWSCPLMFQPPGATLVAVRTVPRPHHYYPPYMISSNSVKHFRFRRLRQVLRQGLRPSPGADLTVHGLFAYAYFVSIAGTGPYNPRWFLWWNAEGWRVPLNKGHLVFLRDGTYQAKASQVNMGDVHGPMPLRYDWLIGSLAAFLAIVVISSIRPNVAVFLFGVGLTLFILWFLVAWLIPESARVLTPLMVYWWAPITPLMFAASFGICFSEIIAIERSRRRALK